MNFVILVVLIASSINSLALEVVSVSEVVKATQHLQGRVGSGTIQNDLNLFSRPLRCELRRGVLNPGSVADDVLFLNYYDGQRHYGFYYPLNSKHLKTNLSNGVQFDVCRKTGPHGPVAANCSDSKIRDRSSLFISSKGVTLISQYLTQAGWNTKKQICNF